MNTLVYILHYHCPKTWTVNKIKTWSGNLRKRKQENRPFKNNFFLVICVCNIILFIVSLIFWRTFQKYDRRTSWTSVGVRPDVMLIQILDFSIALAYRNIEAMLSIARTNCFRDGQGILFGVKKKPTLTA